MASCDREVKVVEVYIEHHQTPRKKMTNDLCDQMHFYSYIAYMIRYIRVPICVYICEKYIWYTWLNITS